ncbi:MAG TPA: nucleoside hydrolase [Edaphobacter sp.]|nr:nucleoside hydrolase [Edaphobacter sp.]
MTALGWLLLVVLAATAGDAQTRRRVIIDQDGAGPGGTDQMAMMVLLQSPQADVLGITMVTGDAWEPEEVQHTLRMLELIHRTDVPVVPGAIFPLVRTQQETKLLQQLYGSFPWYGAWSDLAPADANRKPYHGAYDVPKLIEGEPVTRPAQEDAAHFLIRQIHAHPHEVTIYAAGPLTNIALALSIDPQFAELTHGIVIMGGSLSPQTADPEFANNPRHEFNFWFDPEAAHIILRAHWPRIDLTTADISVKTGFTRAMLEDIAHSPNPAAKYLATYTDRFSYCWDELAAAAWLDPAIITREQKLYVDVNLTRGPFYGDTLSWTAETRPALDLQLVHVQTDLDLPRFNKLLVDLMKAAPNVPSNSVPSK